METINSIELRDEQVFPDEAVLEAILGKSYAAYRELLKLFGDNAMEPEWRYYKDGKAWLCKVQQKKRTIVWMSAWKGYMQATVYLPERHLEALLSLDISPEAKEKIRATENTGKSKPCIFEIRSKAVLPDFDKVMRFKMASK
jgi:hypothetical protein